MEDVEEPMDTSDPSLEEAENSGDVESLPQHRMDLKLYIPVLERMQFQKKNSMQDDVVIRRFLNVARAAGEGSLYAYSEGLNSFEKRLKKWIFDRPPTPPEVKNVEFKKKNGKLIATWTPPEWPLSIRYCGQCAQSSGKREVVDQFDGIRETSYELSNVSPIQHFVLTVWAVNSKGQKGEEKRSKRDILCKNLGNVFVDTTSPLRIWYRVYKGYLKTVSPDLDPVAVKMVDGENLREVKALQRVKHRNVVTYRASGNISESRNVEKQIFIAMELCSTDTFQELVVNNKLNMHCCKISLLHMMLGLAAIHEAGFLHRDLKPQNLLRSLGKDDKDGEDMKVADFGLCKEMDPNKSKVTKSVLEVGTEGWGSPEHYEPGAKMSVKSDIYSGGLVAAFGLSCGKHVYGSKAYDWKPSIIEDREMNLSILVCDNAEIAKDMVSKMLQRDPDNRPTAKQVLAHPFFWNDEKKLNFLHHMSSYFTPVIFGNVTCEHLTRIVMNDLDARKSIFWTKHRHVNWVDKMKETPGVCFRYRHVLLTARGEVYPYTRYNHTSVFDLIRFIRNVEEHYRDENFREAFDNMKCNVWKFFYKCFPTLLCTVYNAVYKHFPKVKYCREFPNDAAKFFTEPAHYEPLPPSS